MSRSRRHTPIGGIASATSEKSFKRETNHTFRQKQRQAIRRVVSDEDIFLPTKPRHATNPWGGPKDGKSWFGNMKNRKKRYPNDLDPEKTNKIYEKGMRK